MNNIHRVRTKLSLAIGYFALTVAVAVAYTNPQTGTELSIYESTPIVFWLGVGIALLIAILILFRQEYQRDIQAISYALAGSAVVLIIGLPILRGYHFYGRGDALSHLGWMGMLETGQLNPTELLYPSVHTAGVFVHTLTGVTLPQAGMFVVVILFIVYLLFIPLCVRLITNDRPATIVAVFSALLLLPINNVSVHPVVHPTSQAILFVPLLLFLLFRYMISSKSRSSGSVPVSTMGSFVIIAGVAMILYHPQQALNVVLLFVAIAAVQFGARRGLFDSPIRAHQPIYTHTVVILIAYVVWTVRFERVHIAVESVFTGLIAGEQIASEVGQRAVSLAALGASIEEIFVKLFLVGVIYSLLAAGVVLYHVGGRSVGRSPHSDAIITYIILASIPAVVLFAVFLVADATTQYVRYVGFLMVFTTILGSIAIAHGMHRFRRRIASNSVYGAFAIIFMVFLILQLVTVHPSPYIYQPSPDVSKSEIVGYEVAFETRNQTIPMTGVRSGPFRFADAYYGPDAIESDIHGARSFIPEDAFNDNVPAAYNGTIYLVTGEADYQSEIELFREFRYSKQGFENLERTRGIDHIQSTGGTDLYLIRGDAG